VSLDDFFSVATQKAMAVGASIALVVGVAQAVITQRHGSIAAWVRGMFAAVVVGISISLLMADWQVSESVKTGVICVAVYNTDDVLQGIKTLFSLFANNPFDIVKRVRAALSGGKAEE
jgi:hypothetical protein